MKILALIAENIKKLKVVEIKPSADVVQLTGNNGNGKTSVLDAIWWALAGKDAMQEVPIRRGEQKARVRLDLGDIVVERRLATKGDTEYTTTLTVRNAEGASYPSPQAMLDQLIGSLSFDPLAFMRMPRREQFYELCRISNLGIDLDAIDQANARDYESRRELSRQARIKKVEANGVVVPETLPDAPIDEEALLGKMEHAAKHNATIDQRKANRAMAERDAQDKLADAARSEDRIAMDTKTTADRIADMRRQIEMMQADSDACIQLLRNRAEAARCEAAAILRDLAEAPPLPPPIDIAELRLELDAARRTNALIDKRRNRDSLLAVAKDLEAQADALTDGMKAREEGKSCAIAASKLPVPGLGFGAGTVTFNGLPLAQASDAEQLRVSCAIVMANNPKLKVLRVRDGSLLDDNGMAILAEMARERDFQVWIERVAASGEVAVVLEDGEVKAQANRGA